MHLTRPMIRHVAAALAAAIATIYFLIGFGALSVVNAKPGDPSLLPFGLFAGSGFLVGAVLLVTADRRILWALGAVLQVLVAIMYVAIAPQRDPQFEVWGITLRVIQVPLFAALLYLATHSAEPHAASLAAQRRRF